MECPGFQTALRISHSFLWLHTLLSIELNLLHSALAKPDSKKGASPQGHLEQVASHYKYLRANT
jgi:hypothetical protein